MSDDWFAGREKKVRKELGLESFAVGCEAVAYALSQSKQRISVNNKTIQSKTEALMLRKYTDSGKVKRKGSKIYFTPCLTPEVARLYCADSRNNRIASSRVGAETEAEAVAYLAGRYGDCA